MCSLFWSRSASGRRYRHRWCQQRRQCWRKGPSWYQHRTCWYSRWLSRGYRKRIGHSRLASRWQSLTHDLETKSELFWACLQCDKTISSIGIGTAGDLKSDHPKSGNIQNPDSFISDFKRSSFQKVGQSLATVPTIWNGTIQNPDIFVRKSNHFDKMEAILWISTSLVSGFQIQFRIRTICKQPLLNNSKSGQFWISDPYSVNCTRINTQVKILRTEL